MCSAFLRLPRHRARHAAQGTLSARKVTHRRTIGTSARADHGDEADATSIVTAQGVPAWVGVSKSFMRFADHHEGRTTVSISRLVLGVGKP